MKYKIVFLLLFLFITNLIASNDLQKIKLQLQWKNQYEFAGFYIAKEKGYYKDIGLDVELLEFNSGVDVVQEVLNNDVQFGIWSSGLVAKWLNGDDIVLLSNYFKRSPLALITKPEIKVPTDLIGKKIMIHKKDQNSANYQQMFKTFGINDTNTNFVEPNFNLQNFNDIDAYSIFLTNEPFTFIKNSISYNILDPNNYGIEFEDVNLFTSNEFAKQNPKLVDAFIKASNKGWEFAINNIDETIDIILDKYNTQNKSKEALLFEAKESQKFIQSKFYEIGSLNVEKLEKIMKFYIELGLVTTRKNINQFIFPNNLNYNNLNLEEIQFIKNNPEIIVANDNSYAPLDYLNNNVPTGYSVDLIKFILESYGIKVKFKTYEVWDDAVKDFFDKKVHVLSSVFRSKKYSENSITTNSYLKAQNVILTNYTENNIKSINDLEGKIVALPKAYSYLDILKENNINFKYLEVKNMEEAVKAVFEGRAQATIESNVVIDYILDKKGYVNLHKVYKLFEDENQNIKDFVFAVNNDKPILAQLINKGLDTLSIQERRQFSRKWFNYDNSSENIEKIILNQDEKNYIKNHKVLKVSNEMDYAPFDFAIDNQPTGYSIDLLNLIAKKTGLKVEYVNGYKWNELMNQFIDKKLDVLHTLSIKKNREKLGLFSEAYGWHRNYFITNIDNPDIKSIEDLNGKIVAVGKDWALERYLYEKYPEIKLLVLDSLDSILEAVQSGDAYATILGNLTAKYSMKKYGFFNLKQNAWFKEFDQNSSASYHFLVQNDNEILRNILNKGLKSLTVSELNELENKWFGELKENKKFLYLTNEEKEYLEKKDSILMCVDPQWLPLEAIKDDKYIGMAADIINLIKEKTNLNIKLVPTKTWSESVEKAQKRECDIFSLAMKTPKRLEYMDFTKPYLLFPFVIATLNNEIYIDDVGKIINKRIAIVKDYAPIELLKNRFPDRTFIEVENVNEGLKLLNEKQIYAFIDNLVSVAYGIQQNNYVNIKISGKFDEKWELSIATRNDEPLLKTIMQKSLNLITESEKQKAYNKWFSVKFEQSVDYSIIWKIILFTVFIILFSLYWNNKLYLEKNKTKEALENLKDLQNELEIKNKELEKISVTDKLTNLYNRYKLDEVLNYELLRFKRTKNSFGVIILDIDYFKLVNDKYGHNVGDKVLIKIATLIKNNIRQTDILGRWGGEEFLIIAPDTKKDDLIYLAEKLRKIIEEEKIEIVGNKTCSFGVTIANIEDTEDSIIERADSALYFAKNRGRNKVEFM